MTEWKTEQVKDLTGKVILVTGGNSGLGYETVKFFAGKGASVILASRSLERGEKAKVSILQDVPQGKIEVMALDLASLASVKTFSDQFLSSYDRLDVLMNNAGIMTTPYGKTADGLEQQQGVNHFGHFALTGHLFTLLAKTPGARIVNTSSSGHRGGKMDFDNLLFEKGGYRPFRAYSRSKLENLLFTYELQRKVEAAGLDIKVLAAHPGGSNTNLARHVEGNFWFRLLMPILERWSQSAYDGALPQIRAAVESEAKGGSYYGPDGFMEMSGKPVIVGSTKASHSKEDAARLWKLSEELTSVVYDFEVE